MSKKFLQKLAKYDGLNFINKELLSNNFPLSKIALDSPHVEMKSPFTGSVAPNPTNLSAHSPGRPFDWAKLALPAEKQGSGLRGYFDGTTYHGFAAEPVHSGDPLQNPNVGSEPGSLETKNKAIENLLSNYVHQKDLGQKNVSFKNDPSYESQVISDGSYIVARAYCGGNNFVVEGASPSPSPRQTAPAPSAAPASQTQPNAATPKSGGKTLGQIWKEKVLANPGADKGALLQERYRQIDRQKLDNATTRSLKQQAGDFIKSKKSSS